MACADALGLDEFDETAFLEQVDHIEVPKRYQIEIHMKDGMIIQKDCTPTGHQDCWTQEYRDKVSEQRRKNGTNPKGASCFTAKIKCAECGNNYRRQTRKRSTGEESPYSINIDNEKMAFLQNGNEIAYVQYNKMHINAIEAMDRMSVGAAADGGYFDFNPFSEYCIAFNTGQGK